MREVPASAEIFGKSTKRSGVFRKSPVRLREVRGKSSGRQRKVSVGLPGSHRVGTNRRDVSGESSGALGISGESSGSLRICKEIPAMSDGRTRGLRGKNSAAPKTPRGISAPPAENAPQKTRRQTEDPRPGFFCRPGDIQPTSRRLPEGHPPARRISADSPHTSGRSEDRPVTPRRFPTAPKTSRGLCAGPMTFRRLP